MADIITTAADSSGDPPPAEGRVLRLHFACRAALPHGSTLRVTSTRLWAPDSSSAHITEGETAHVSGGGGGSEDSAADFDHHGPADSDRNMYASSVEMVTTPDAYPVWRTRTPVVVVANSAGGTVQKHRYRYMVVTPGVDTDALTDGGEAGGGGMSQDAEEMLTAEAAPTDSPDHAARLGGGAHTSADENGDGPLSVMMWEDPFVENRNPSRPDPSVSVVSLPSVRRKNLSLGDLPWRTIEIDLTSLPPSGAIQSNSVGVGGGGIISSTSSSSSSRKAEFTDGGIRVDHWNDETDPTFRQYIENEEAKARNKVEAEAIMEDEAYREATGTEADMVIDDDDAAGDITGQGTASPEGGEDGAASSKRMVLVCYHLPVILTRDPSDGSWSACWSESLIAKTEAHTITNTYETHWVGTVSTVPPIATEEEKDAVRAVLAPMNCTPIFLNHEVEEAHYLGMCKQVLWPCFHNVDLLDLSASGWGQRESMEVVISKGNGDEVAVGNTDSDWDQSKLDGWWSSYRAVNAMFADVMSMMLRPYDMVWIHDYHLTLLPKMIHDAEIEETGKRTVEMIFFLHIPFPTSQVFRELEHGEAILEGMLHADVVGFHAFDHARHFLNASKRILGLTYESLVGGLIGVRYRRKKVLVTVSNVSIEPDIIDAALALPSVTEGTKALKEKHAGREIITGVDIAQRLSGVFLKLLGYERLLHDYPVWQTRVVMIQRCLVPGTRHADEADTLKEVRALVNRIRTKFGHGVIDYEEVFCSALPIDQRLSLWSASDVLIISPVREGFNTVPLEYVYARKEPSTPGVVITSEFSAINSILNGALRINPYDIQMAVTFMDKALTMSVEEKEARRSRDIDFVSSCPSGMWTRNVLRDLRDATSGTNADGTKNVDGEAAARIESVEEASAILSENNLEFPPLDVDAVTRAYKSASQRVLVIDFNGTLVMKEPPGKYLKREMLGTTGNKPPDIVLKALGDLCKDPRNTVLVVSGDTQKNLEDALGNVPGLGLAHSNGACYSIPLPGETKRDWLSYDLGVDWEAVKKTALPILSKYTARTNGSFVKLTHSSLGWTYYSCDPEWGALQASYLVPELERELSAFDVRFVTLKGVVEVVPRKLNKGLVVKRILEEVASTTGGKPVDFILCMGDDVSDEKMFTSVFSFISESNAAAVGSGDSIMEDVSKDQASAPVYAFTVAVGKKKTHASYYVDSSRDVPHLLVGMSGGRIPISQSSSWESEDSKRDLFS